MVFTLRMIGSFAFGPGDQLAMRGCGFWPIDYWVGGFCQCETGSDYDATVCHLRLGPWVLAFRPRAAALIVAAVTPATRRICRMRARRGQDAAYFGLSWPRLAVFGRIDAKNLR